MGWKKKLAIISVLGVVALAMLFIFVLAIVFFAVAAQPTQEAVPQIMQTEIQSIDCATVVQNLSCYNEEISKLSRNRVNLGNMTFQIVGEKCGLGGMTEEDVGLCVFYYPLYCDNIQPDNLEVRKATAQATKNVPGSYSLDQVIATYAWVKENVQYLNVPLDKHEPFEPDETLYVGSGDCKNQAVLLASMVSSLSGNTRIVIVPECEHAYAQVYVGDTSTDIQKLAGSISEHYLFQQGYVYAQKDSKGTWLTLDPAGANYPGAVLPACQKATKQYVITKC